MKLKAKLIIVHFILFLPAFLAYTLRDRFLIKSVKRNRSLKEHFHVVKLLVLKITAFFIAKSR
eukprot:UN25056